MSLVSTVVLPRGGERDPLHSASASHLGNEWRHVIADEKLIVAEQVSALRLVLAIWNVIFPVCHHNHN